jgi:hypothetical protein
MVIDFNPPQDFMDFEKTRDYLSAHMPEQVAVDSRSWVCSPTDILSIADMLSMALKADDHAIALYKEGLRRLNEHPEQIDPIQILLSHTPVSAKYSQEKIESKRPLMLFTVLSDGGATTHT